MNEIGEGGGPNEVIAAAGDPTAVATDAVTSGALSLLGSRLVRGSAADTIEETLRNAGSVLKGPIADQAARNFPQQLALGAAKEGQGTIIMRNLSDTQRRLVANHGEGEWVKMQYVLRGTDSNVTVHYFRNLSTKSDVEFKFK